MSKGLIVIAIILGGIYSANAMAQDDICAREIEGVTVNMTPEQVKLIWASKGYINTSSPRTPGQISFLDHIPVANEGYRPEKVQLSFMESDSEIILSKSYFDQDGSVEAARKAEFCPNGQSRAGRIKCVYNRGMSTNISVEPENPQSDNVCYYSFGKHGLVTESVRLVKKYTPLRQPANSESQGRPALKRNRG
ncbi:MAG: hypothetical protein ACWA5L_05850 [bacterium]